MKLYIKRNSYDRFLLSKDDIIIEVSKDIFQLTGYTRDDLVGKSILRVSELLRMDSQVYLDELTGSAPIFLFTKDLRAIEGSISCQELDGGEKKIYKFIKTEKSLIQKRFDLANQLGKNRGEGVAIYSVSNKSFDGILIDCNQTYLDVLEAPYNNRENSIGKKIMDIAQDYLKIEINNVKDQVANTSKTYYIREKLIKDKNSKENYFNLAIVPIVEDDEINCFLLSLSDVTEEVSNRKALERRNEELEALIDNMSDEIIIFDKDLNITTSNKLAKEKSFLGRSNINNLKELMDSTTIYDKDNIQIAYENFPSQRIKRGEHFENYIIKGYNSQKVHYRETSGIPIYDKDNNFIGGVIIYRNIDDRISKEERTLIETQNKLLTKVVETLNLEFIRCTYPELDIISINGYDFTSFIGTENTNIPNAYAVGESYFTIYPIYEEAKKSELKEYLIEKGNYSFVDYTEQNIEGEKRFFKTINQPIFGLNNKIIEIIFITIDITDEIKAKNIVEETLEMQNQMFSTISHELKTPLNVIFSASQLIDIYIAKAKNCNIKDDINDNNKIIKQNCYRFIKLINNIIDLSSMESGFYKLNYSNTNIVETVESIVDSVRSYIADKGLNIIFDTEEEEILTEVDIDKLDRIILNLISNAVKFSPKNGEIFVCIKKQKKFVEILVRDQGMGIDKKHLVDIFEKYKRIDNSLTRKTEGSGIGLALVKTMTALMGGEISVVSDLGRGSIFKVKLPIRQIDPEKVIDDMDIFDNRTEKLNIEFSDIYSK